MAAAYASLVSLKTVIYQIRHHPSPPIDLKDEHVESLCKNITSLQDFLEVYSHGAITEAADGLERRIMEAAYAAEDVIESHVVDQILSESSSGAKKQKINAMDHWYQSLQKVLICGKTIDMVENFYQSLQKVVDKFDFLAKEVTPIQVHRLPVRSVPAGSVSYPSEGRKSDMVGFDHVLRKVLDELTGHSSSLQIMPIVGMGGIGKTTLARNAYESQLVMDHFDIRSWVTISREYTLRDIFLWVLSYRKNNKSGGDLSHKSKEELGEILHKTLWNRRYLVVMDDMWNIKVWDEVRHFFPDDNNGSRIIVTTRISSMFSQLTNSCIFKLNLLDEDQSWKLLSKTVFGEEACPVELEEVAKGVAKNCKGLPLSIVVMGGFLAKSPWTREYWEKIAENLKSILNLEDDQRCMKILHSSYDHLPVHLKPCFLYMGIFPEDSEVKASILIKLWVAEGFLEVTSGESLEEVAQKYLKDLVDRNLILVKSLGFKGKIKLCHIHDLLRDLCLEEAKKEKFYGVYEMQNLGVRHDMNAQRRLIYHGFNSEEGNIEQLLNACGSTSPVRSLIGDLDGFVPRLPFKLLRILKLDANRDLARNKAAGGSFGDFLSAVFKKVGCSHEAISELLNSRFLCVDDIFRLNFMLPPSMHRIWNLQTLIINTSSVVVPHEFWKMHQIRHVKLGEFRIPDPPSGQEFGLWNLQSLSKVIDFKLSDEVVRRIPNIKKLKCDNGYDHEYSYFCIHNLGHLQKLESLTLMLHEKWEPFGLQQNLDLVLPNSLQKLCLKGTKLRWEDMTTKFGSLPLIQVLKLHSNSVIGSEWDLAEVKFRSLRILEIQYCGELECWVAESIHFPRLKHIHLKGMRNLKEIPSDIGEIPTLRSIKLVHCGKPVIDSAQEIQKKQEELGNSDPKIEVED